MRRLERMVAAHSGSRKELVQVITHQTCLQRVQVQRLVRALELEQQVMKKCAVPHKPHPTVLVECLSAPDPIALAKEAIEEEWTAQRVRSEAAKRKAASEAKLRFVAHGSL